MAGGLTAVYIAYLSSLSIGLLRVAGSVIAIRSLFVRHSLTSPVSILIGSTCFQLFQAVVGVKGGQAASNYSTGMYDLDASISTQQKSIRCNMRHDVKMFR